MTKFTYDLGGDLTVNRLGFGTVRLTGPGFWGDPPDRTEAIRILRRAVELGVDLVDTSDAYGPYVVEDLIREALHPYDHVTIATKGGLVRPGPNESTPVGRPEYLRQCVAMSLRRLGLERIDLYQLHRIDPQVPLEDQVGVLKEMRDEGKIRHIGLSEVSVSEIEQARKITPIVSVQNLYNLTNRQHEEVLDHCQREGIGFIPWFPLAVGDLAKPGGAGPLDKIAKETGATPSQLALAWLLRRSPVMLPIPGTTSMAHLEENCRATDVTLTEDQFAAIASAI
ncbi:oxidoreductase [Longimycelium tulufanense]|uniref:Oxidoreductase n=1 Tax=Longimycelium tulufanense TaxID=907463 RepID=A0A8J3CG66_9PSEU|nr:aldo/keto reductase [Longimycelium tulufanense]GGM73952.1 oxidoreductase [Longimycelium tulufanense]